MARRAPTRRAASCRSISARDQLVLALADPEQIVGLSPYAADPSLSVVAEKARAFRALDWQAESTIALSPDLVLVGQSDRPVTQAHPARAGLRLVEIALIADLDAARAPDPSRSRRVLGHPERGEKLIADIDAARGAPARRAEAAASRPRCWSTAAATRRASAASRPRCSPRPGLMPPPGAPPGYGGYVPLERLLMLRPDVIVLNDLPSEAGRAGQLQSQPPGAARALSAGSGASCCRRATRSAAAPALVAAFDYLGGAADAARPVARRCAPTDRARRSARPARAAGSAPT